MKGRTTEPPKAGWALTQERLAAMIPTQRRRYLLFGDMLDDTGASTSIFPRESVEVSYCMPDPRTWTQALEPAAVRQNRLLGVLKAAEARGRIRAMRLRYTRMRVCQGPTGRAHRAGGRRQMVGGLWSARQGCSVSLVSRQRKSRS